MTLDFAKDWYPSPPTGDFPVPMFSAPGHQDTIWSAVKGEVAQSRQIKWTGGTAATHSIVSVAGAAEVRTRALELHFSWNAGYVEADAQSKRQVHAYQNRARYALVLPPETNVEFRIKEKSNYRFLTIEFDPRYVLQVAELQHLNTVEVLEVWDYNHPLTWYLAQAVANECDSEARQGLLYAESAITLLALHVVRSLSSHDRPLKLRRRGGLAPVFLSRVSDYMSSRLAEDVSLSEAASICGLSAGHFAFAFKQSTGMPPHAWLRRQRIDRSKALLLDGELNLVAIARAVGFANQSAFGVAFKKETGLTPAVWRRLHLI